uniref:Metallo-beta-lactamase domain-containing protein n=1 Tax=Odontella aurita TaxID=265563 RepID=A0A7S4N8F9_9STRA|mmetsp:Transcript_5181/g.14948  ORF Transcript_5181/g.14948 Transcript_5181/m.14948 type:complete len:1299 (+) Transcript_5181:581-4477(+)
MVRAKGLKKLFSAAKNSGKHAACASSDDEQQHQHPPQRQTPQHHSHPVASSQASEMAPSSSFGSSGGLLPKTVPSGGAKRVGENLAEGSSTVRLNRMDSAVTEVRSNVASRSGTGSSSKSNGGVSAATAAMNKDNKGGIAAARLATRSAVPRGPTSKPPKLSPNQRAVSLPDDDCVPPPSDLSRFRTTGHKPIAFGGRGRRSSKATGAKDKIFDDPAVVRAYDSIPVLELTKLPRGGVSMDSKAVGRIQFGIPPETIKDSMRLGLEVPSVYIVPVERFCREMGPALGVNLAEFEFPAYFNFFVQRKRCTLIVDSDDAERNIRRVFSETLLGPAQFRKEDDFITHEEEDFAPDFHRDAIPNFQKEFKHFRIMPDGKELVLETLLKFRHFHSPKEGGAHEGLGIPPPLDEVSGDAVGRRKKRSGSFNASMTSLEAGGTPGKCEEKKVASGEERRTGTMKSLEEKRSSYVKTTDDLPGNALAAGGNVSPRTREELIGPNEDEGKGGKPWQYSQAKWIGDVSTVFPEDATPEQIANNTAKRVEIFKMPGGTEYIVHDIDENNIIIGKARFSGHVRVSEYMSVDGFGGRDFVTDIMTRRKSTEMNEDEEDKEEEKDREKISIPESVLPPTFHPPSFGVTVLGNSHGFDKSGSVSGYVLWINGRGVMIDPPPYSSATLEREGIRPRNIVGIILTHCHADHDAGAFQKVLTGTQVVVITTPTIYKSFIRKYAALSALSPALLRHSHRHKPAIIGTPLRFQGATFQFTYMLHTIPCVGFKVEWRGRSMVFTGDHFNNPPAMEKLVESGVLSKARADDLVNMPLQETDLLLHESGAPPIHTPLDVLLKLPPRVKKRLYVVHTSALPEGCELRAAPTGTAGTIRLDQLNKSMAITDRKSGPSMLPKRTSIMEGVAYEDESILQSLWSASEYDSSSFFGDGSDDDLSASFTSLQNSGGRRGISSGRTNPLVKVREPPLVSLRPTSSTDAWFILNLLSAVPFLSSLSYASTMEVLETARVDAFCMNDVVVPASRRRDVLCVVWEGTCMEREESSKEADLHAVTKRLGLLQATQLNKSGDRRTSTFQLNLGTHAPLTEKEVRGKKRIGAVWHAGDWTGPRSLQPDKRLSGESSMGKTHDIVAMSSQGVKVITVEFSNLHEILKSGSPLYRRYLARKAKLSHIDAIPETIENARNRQLFENAVHNLNMIELIDCNSALRKLTAVQKRHLESLAEGPVFYHAGQRLWRAGAPVDRAFIVVAGTVSFVPRRRNAGSVKSTPVSSITFSCPYLCKRDIECSLLIVRCCFFLCTDD